MTDREPPHSVAAERAVIGSALVYGEPVVNATCGLRPEDFMLPEHAEAWKVIVSLVEHAKNPDPVTVGIELQAAGESGRFAPSWSEWWLKCTTEDAHVVDVAAHFAGIVREKATLRRLILLCTEVLNSCYANQPADAVMATARDGVAALEVAGGSDGPVKLGDALAPALETIEKRARKEPGMAIKTRIATVDRITGGMKPGQLIVVAGRPGHGKTSYADNVATNCACAATDECPALFFSIEMPLQEMVERVIGIRARVEVERMGNGELEYSDWKKIQAAAGGVENCPLFIDERPLSLGQIIGEARRWHAREVRAKGRKLGAIFIDYAQLIHVDRGERTENREQELSKISGSLKRLAKALPAPVVLVSQLNREVEKRGGPPMPSDLRGSGSIEQDADVIIFPWRDIPSSDQAARNQSGPAQIIVAKHRNGKTGIARANWTAEWMEFTAATPDDYEGPDTRKDIDG